MSIAVRAEAHHIQTYKDNVAMVAQQKKGRIAPLLTSVPASGEAMDAAELVGRVRAQRGQSRDRRNIENPPMNNRRWLTFPEPIKSGQYIDKAERLQRAMDPTSKYVEAHTMAVIRERDDIAMGIIELENGVFALNRGGILGAAVEGKNPGGAPVVMPARCFSASGGVGLTLAKLLESKERMNIDEFGLDDDDPIYCSITPKQVTNLLQLADGDGLSLNAFQQIQLMNGKPTSLLGFTWVVNNRLPLDSAGARMCPLWSKKNIVEGVWQELQGTMWNDTHADNTPYAKVEAFVDTVRVEDLGVHVLPCVEV